MNQRNVFVYVCLSNCQPIILSFSIWMSICKCLSVYACLFIHYMSIFIYLLTCCFSSSNFFFLCSSWSSLILRIFSSLSFSLLARSTRPKDKRNAIKCLQIDNFIRQWWGTLALKAELFKAPQSYPYGLLHCEV